MYLYFIQLCRISIQLLIAHKNKNLSGEMPLEARTLCFSKKTKKICFNPHLR